MNQIDLSVSDRIVHTTAADLHSFWQTTSWYSSHSRPEASLNKKKSVETKSKKILIATVL